MLLLEDAKFINQETNQAVVLGQTSVIEIEIDAGTESPIVSWYRLKPDSDETRDLTESGWFFI